MVGHRTGRQLLHREELGSVFADMPRAQAIRRAMEVLCESFDEADVVSCGRPLSNDVAGVPPA